MRDFISVVPFFACKAPACSHAGERNRHLQLTRSTESGTSPKLETAADSTGITLYAAITQCNLGRPPPLPQAWPLPSLQQAPLLQVIAVCDASLSDFWYVPTDAL
jgi:hypothetical protein